MIGKMIGDLFWKPAGSVSSVDALSGGSHGVAGTRDVTMAVTGSKDGYPLRVVELAGGKIIGDLRMVATRDNIVIGGMQSLPPGMDPQDHYLTRRRRFRMPKYRRGTALLLGASNSDNYYHWMVDSVPRWKMLEAANWSNYDFVLLHSAPRTFQDDVLDRLGIPSEKRLRCSKNFVHQFERLVVVPTPPVAPWSCAYVRSLIPEKMSGPQKIYLRRGAGRRRLVNEAELERALADIGYISIEPGRLSILEQAKFLSSARCVVAPHGAALTNLIFAPAGAKVLELIHPQNKNGFFLRLASTCGHDYAGFEGRLVNEANAPTQCFIVDVQSVLQTIRTGAY